MKTTKTPEDVKKGLEVCNIWMVDEPNHCMECPYFCTKDCADTLMKHALALIQQLEAERDALYEEVRRCFYCVHADGVLGECDQCCESCEADCPCKECDHNNKFEWRGVQKEE